MFKKSCFYIFRYENRTKSITEKSFTVKVPIVKILETIYILFYDKVWYMINLIGSLLLYSEFILH